MERLDDSVTVPKLTDAYKSDEQQRKTPEKYTSDGTYKEMLNREEIHKGTWKFTSPNKIRETRPSLSKIKSILTKDEAYILTIDILDEKQFRYTEEQSTSGYTSPSGSVRLITMTAHGN